MKKTYFLDKSQHSRCAQAGSTIVEVLVAIVLFGLVGLSMATSNIYGIKFQKRAELGNLATNLAVTKIEQLAGYDPTTLDAGDNSSETGIAVSGHSITFNRVTTITVNSDGSRTVQVTVSSPIASLLTPVTYVTRFAPWES